MQFPKFPKMSTLSKRAQPVEAVGAGGSMPAQRIGAGFAKLKTDRVLARRVAMVGAAIVVVAGAGQVMERNSAAAPVKISAATVVEALPVSEAATQTPTQAAEAVIVEGEAVAALAPAPQPQSLEEALREGALLLPEDPATAGVDLAGLSSEIAFGSELIVSDGTRAAVRCDAPTLALTEQDAGMIAVAFDAPCLGAAVISVHQFDFAFKAETTAEGRYSVVIPALADRPVVEIGMADGAMLRGEITLDAPLVGERVALSWQGAADLSLNAYEYGAAFGGAGHVHASAARTPGNVLGGYLVRLGDEDIATPEMLEIYVAPAGLTELRFDLEAQVSAQTCNQDLTAFMARIRGGAAEPSEKLTLAMPDCDAIGEAIVMPLSDDILTLAMAQ